MDSKKTAQAAAAAADAKKASDIVIMEMTKVMLATDYFVIASANTATQVRAIADNIEESLNEKGVSPARKEGYREGEWVLLDYNSVVVHIFRTEAREYYALEALWSDADFFPYEGGL